MAFPLKFKNRLELTRADVDLPLEAWIVYAVCGCEHDSCGWEGWMIECVFSGKDPEKTLKCMNEQICPVCRKRVFRTDTQIRMVYSDDQSGSFVVGKDFESMPMKYE